MNILITGASGFIGSHITRQLLSRGHKVHLILREPMNAWRIHDLLDQCTVIKSDLENLFEQKNILKKLSIDCVIHSAWRGVSGADRNSNIQLKNLDDLIIILELVKDLGIKNFVGIGSQAEYGPQTGKISEHQITNPTTLYGILKLAAYQIAKKYSIENGFRFAWMRVFSSYGPMDHDYWLIPSLIKDLLSGLPPQTTLAEQKWDYIFITDLADAIIRVCENNQANGIFNLGSGYTVKLKNLIEDIQKQINKNIKINFGAIPYRADQVMHLEADISRLYKVTGWTPSIGIKEGIAETIKWSRKQHLKN